MRLIYVGSENKIVAMVACGRAVGKMRESNKLPWAGVVVEVVAVVVAMHAA